MATGTDSKTPITDEKTKTSVSDSAPILGSVCPACGAREVEASTPRTVYACGSSDYDQRPGTFIASTDCKIPDACPQCKSDTGIKIPRDRSVYCEDCGWPYDDFDEA
mgnify:CR=1 FL=1